MQNDQELIDGLDPIYGAPRATHRHKKRGSEYTLLGFGKIQSEHWRDKQPEEDMVHFVPIDMREVAVYRSLADGSLWVRPREEFEDGRFEALC